MAAAGPRAMARSDDVLSGIHARRRCGRTDATAAGSSRSRKPRCGWPRPRWRTATPPCPSSVANSDHPRDALPVRRAAGRVARARREGPRPLNRSALDRDAARKCPKRPFTTHADRRRQRLKGGRLPVAGAAARRPAGRVCAMALPPAVVRLEFRLPAAENTRIGLSNTSVEVQPPLGVSPCANNP